MKNIKFHFEMKIAAIICGLIFLFGCIKPGEKPQGVKGAMELSGKHILMIIASDGFRDEEYSEPRDEFERLGAKVTVASSRRGEAKGMLGLRVAVDILLSEVNVADYDAVIFVGGVGSSEYWNDVTAHNIAKQAYQQNKIVAAICIAPVTLANAGLLSGKKATVFPSEAAKLRAKGANYTKTEVEVDGNIVTAEGPTAARAFAKKIVQLLKK